MEPKSNKNESYSNKNRIIDSNLVETVFFNEAFQKQLTYLLLQNINDINYIETLEIYLHAIAIINKKQLPEAYRKISKYCNKTVKIQNIEEKSIDIVEKSCCYSV